MTTCPSAHENGSEDRERLAGVRRLLLAPSLDAARALALAEEALVLQQRLRRAAHAPGSSPPLP